MDKFIIEFELWIQAF